MYTQNVLSYMYMYIHLYSMYKCTPYVETNIYIIYYTQLFTTIHITLAFLIIHRMVKRSGLSPDEPVISVHLMMHAALKAIVTTNVCQEDRCSAGERMSSQPRRKPYIWFHGWS